ncbi:MAG: glycosyltransferase [Dysgonamonadaceae bacterium]|jgi:glycosyltransferase involved in cell wall biosynthesis|nr:glycosyltransferase [Dysgonamonadaceae bacterium]
MKFAVLSPFYPYRGGISQFTMMLCRELNMENEVKVFSFSRLYPNFLFPGKSQFVENDEPPITQPQSVRILDSINPFSYEKTVKAINNYQPDVLIIAYWTSFFAPACGYIAKRLKSKTKIIGLIHNAIPHEPHFFDSPLASMFFRQCHKFVVLSESVKKDILRLYPSAQCLMLPHPLYDNFGEPLEKKEARKRFNIDRNKKTLLFFGLIRDYKGLDLLIEAMSRLDDSFQLIIAGECYGDFGKYKRQIDTSPARDRIFALNRYINNSEVPTLFSAADLLVAPYRSATQSGVIPIACHFELPVLVTNVGGLRETVEKSGIGLVCQPQPDSIAEGIKQFFNVENKLFSDKFKKIKDELSWDKFARNFL